MPQTEQHPQVRRTATPDRHTQHRGSRTTPERHRATPERPVGHSGRVGTQHADRLQRQRSTPDRPHRNGSNTPDRHGGRSTPDRHQHNSRRQRRHSANEALLAKRRAEVMRERRILIVLTALCCLASAVSLIQFYPLLRLFYLTFSF